jgi:tRNA-specific adenosine deaminase 1
MWKSGYKFQTFEVRTTAREFAFSRRSAKSVVSSNISAVWTPGFQETLIGGVLQGRKQFDARGASAICRRGMWKACVQVAAVVGVQGVVDVLGKRTYGEIKSDGVFGARKRVKGDVKAKGLQGWVRNAGDEGFGLGE